MSDFITLRLRPSDYVFKETLREGVINMRPNRFIMWVTFNGESEPVKCHCPNTGTIGNINLVGRPCLASYHDNPTRKMAWDIEAISYDKPETKEKTWIGINTGATNRYVEHFLKHGMFDDMVKVYTPRMVEREKRLGDARIDFRVGDTYLEVKTWTQVIEKRLPSWVEKTIHEKPFLYSGGDRLVKHANQLSNALQSHQRCIMLGCYQYIPDRGKDIIPINYGVLYKDTTIIREAFDNAHRQGVESWECIMEITPEKVKLINYKKED